jgi:hypothetical protein
MSVESSSAPMRRPTSMPASTMLTTLSVSMTRQLTCGWRSAKRVTAGATYIWPNCTGAVTNNGPAGSAAPSFSAVSASRMSDSTLRQLSRKRRPFVGQRDAARGAVEQAYPQVRFERGQRAHHRRQRTVHRARGRGQAAVLGDLHEGGHCLELVHPLRLIQFPDQSYQV